MPGSFSEKRFPGGRKEGIFLAHELACGVEERGNGGQATTRCRGGEERIPMDDIPLDPRGRVNDLENTIRGHTPSTVTGALASAAWFPSSVSAVLIFALEN